MGRERLSELQQRLLSNRKEQQQRFVDDYLVSATQPFDKLRDRLLELFDIDIEEKVGNGAFLGTPAQLRSVLDELLVLGKIWDVDIERAVWRKYPNICPYCLSKPSICGGQKSRPHRKLRVPFPEMGLSLAEAQRMLAEIYPDHPLREAVLHVVEEIDEAETEIASLGKERDVQDEFADIFARIVGLATGLGIYLEDLIL